MKMLCPHCSTSFKIQEPESTYHETGARYVEYEKLSVGYEVKSFLCPECNDIIIMLRRGDLSTVGSYYHMNPEDMLEEKMIYPRTTDTHLSVLIPEKYRKDYKEAALILPISPKASAAICRRMLQQILREQFSIEKKDLYQEIGEFISLPNIPSFLADSVDAIRVIGNLAAHPLKSKQTGEIMEVEDGEAEWLLEVLETLFDFTFIQPIKLQERQDRLNTRLRELGKGEMLKK
ncbi:DUF4145 domain-containing protein [Paenibacillus sp. FSL L8-0436]|uniref:DUF4145 domain-containing protein n=1 Tax=Paenibacillus sp. FSL L8-0436 TaxID=2954686 RepID=UPI003158AF33